MYCDSVTQALERENTYLYQVIAKNDSTISIMESKERSIMEVADNNQRLVNGLNSEIIQNEKSLRKERRRGNVFAIALGVVITLVIL